MAAIDPLDALIDSLPPALSRIHTARESAKAAKEFGVDAGKFDMKTVEGRKQLSLAISIAKLAKLYDEKGGDEEDAISSPETVLILAPEDDAAKGDNGKNPAASPLRKNGQSMPDALLAYDAATPSERRKLKRQVRNKVFASAKHRPGEFGQTGSEIRKLAQKHFAVQPPPPYVAHPLGSPRPIY